MTLFGAIRTKTLLNRRPRRQSHLDVNADSTVVRSTGDPRLDLARAVNMAAYAR